MNKSVLSLAVITVVEGLQCFQCTGVSEPKDCTTVVLHYEDQNREGKNGTDEKNKNARGSNQDNQCFTDFYVTEQGFLYYDLGCRIEDICLATLVLTENFQERYQLRCEKKHVCQDSLSGQFHGHPKSAPLPFGKRQFTFPLTECEYCCDKSFCNSKECVKVCGPKAADIIFALDASESLTAADFEIEKEFVYNFTKQFKIGRDNVQFGAITIADHPRPDFYLNTYHDRRHLLDKIQSLVFLQSGTNTADTLKIIHDEMFKGGHGGRHSASRIVVVLTDGMSKETNRTREEAHNLQKVATVHAIGIGSLVNNEELAAIDSNRKPGTVTGFDVLHTMGDYLMEIACPGTHTALIINVSDQDS
uniref:Collagen alpha-1(XXI) chain n=1 Tax=Magallana gigas TaxID=29159 RepID=K1R760_MAGGI